MQRIKAESIFELGEHMGKLTAMAEAMAKAGQDNQRLLEAHQQLITALEFYADGDTWWALGIHSCRVADDRGPDDIPGRRAREALEAWRRATAASQS